MLDRHPLTPPGLQLGRKDDKDEPYAYEAREFLRSRLIGRKVTVGIDYIRALPNR